MVPSSCPRNRRVFCDCHIEERLKPRRSLGGERLGLGKVGLVESKLETGGTQLLRKPARILKLGLDGRVCRALDALERLKEFHEQVVGLVELVRVCVSGLPEPHPTAPVNGLVPRGTPDVAFANRTPPSQIKLPDLAVDDNSLLENRVNGSRSVIYVAGEGRSRLADPVARLSIQNPVDQVHGIGLYVSVCHRRVVEILVRLALAQRGYADIRQRM